KLVYSIEVDRDRNLHPINRRQHAVLILTPFRKAAQILKDIGRIGMKNMRSVLVYKNAIIVVKIVCIAADMRTDIADQQLFPDAVRQPLGKNTAGKPGSDN